MPDAFSIILDEVAEDVYKRLGKRTNASVKLIPFNPTILGYVKANDYTIYLNSIPFSLVKNDPIKSREYLYVVILHEYLHLVGIADEREVRKITTEITAQKFGRTSYAYLLAEKLTDPIDLHLMNKRDRPPMYM